MGVFLSKIYLVDGVSTELSHNELRVKLHFARLNNLELKNNELFNVRFGYKKAISQL